MYTTGIGVHYWYRSTLLVLIFIAPALIVAIVLFLHLTSLKLTHLHVDRDLLASRERLLLERATQRSTIQELRAHIDVLSDALTNARSSTFKYEEEVFVSNPVVYKLP